MVTDSKFILLQFMSVLYVSVSLAQLEIPTNLDKLAKGTPAFSILSVCLSVCLTTKDKLTGPNVEYLSNYWSNLTQI